MPYLNERERKGIDPYVDPLVAWVRQAKLLPGGLNYIVTRIAQAYLGDDPRYLRYNDVIGALEAAKLEMYRRAAGPYEDKKAKENGDVWRV